MANFINRKRECILPDLPPTNVHRTDNPDYGHVFGDTHINDRLYFGLALIDDALAGITSVSSADRLGQQKRVLSLINDFEASTKWRYLTFKAIFWTT